MIADAASPASPFEASRGDGGRIGAITAGAMLILSLGLSLALFSPLLRSDPTLLCDDYSILASQLEDGRLDVARVAGLFTGTPNGLSGRYYRPVFYLSYGLDYFLGGGSPRFFYIMNVIYHGMAAWLLWLGLRFLGIPARWALGTFLIFLVHPVHIEAVAWIAGRTSSLAAVFSLGALAAFAGYRRTGRVRALVLYGIALGLSLLTREEGIVLPGILLAFDVCLRPWRTRPSGEAARMSKDPRRGSASREAMIRETGGVATLRKLIAPYLTAIGIIAIYLIVRRQALGEEGSGEIEEVLRSLGSETRWLGILASMRAYLVPTVESVFNEYAVTWIAALTGTLCTALLVLGLIQWIRPGARSVLTAVAIFFVLASLPSLPILAVNRDLMNSRCFYLPSAALSIFLAAGLHALALSGRRILRLGAAAAVVAGAAGGAALLVENQSALIEACEKCRAFTVALRDAGHELVVVPRFEYQLYADRDGDDVIDDEAVRFIRRDDKTESRIPADPSMKVRKTVNPSTVNPSIGNPSIGNPSTGNPSIGNPSTGNPSIGNPSTGDYQDGLSGPSDAPRAVVLVNVPRLHKGIYIFWGGLEFAMMPDFGDPGVAVLFTELFTPRNPDLSPEGSLLRPLLEDGTPLIKWTGESLVRVEAGVPPADSLLGRDWAHAAASDLGRLTLMTDARLPATQFTPRFTLPAEAVSKSPEAWRYRIVTPLGDSRLPASPVRVEDRWRFDPASEAVAGPLFRSVAGIPQGLLTGGRRLADFDEFPCILMVETLKADRVEARSRPLVLYIDFPN